MDEHDRTLLEFLQGGALQSGEHLAEHLSISRAAVAKRLKRLAQDLPGLTLRSAKGRGYVAEPCYDLLPRAESWPEDLRATMSSIEIRLHMESTNSAVAERLRTQPGPLLCVAECQTAGRGRKGRKWVSPFAKNLYFSLGVTYPSGFGELSALSPVVAIAIAEILEAGGLDVGLKWPNDIYVDGRKIAGILLEAQGEGDGPLKVVIGVGLNFAAADARMDAEIGQPWTSVQAQPTWQGGARPQLLWDLVRRIHRGYQQFVEAGFAPMRPGWLERDLFVGQVVELSNAAHEIERGIHRGIDENGALLLQLHDGNLAVRNGGELSLRSGSPSE